MEPNYVARKSAWSCISFLSILACILIIPIFVLVFRIIAAKKFRLEFYDDKIIIKRGWLNTSEEEMVFMGITSMTIKQSIWGKLFKYGTVSVNCVGPWDVNLTTLILEPEKLKQYLQSRIVAAPAAQPLVHM